MTESTAEAAMTIGDSRSGPFGKETGIPVADRTPTLDSAQLMRG
ncbi:hypothetical protein [Streptomyces sp. NPDC006012]